MLSVDRIIHTSYIDVGFPRNPWVCVTTFSLWSRSSSMTSVGAQIFMNKNGRRRVHEYTSSVCENNAVHKPTQIALVLNFKCNYNWGRMLLFCSLWIPVQLKWSIWTNGNDIYDFWPTRANAFFFAKTTIPIFENKLYFVHTLLILFERMLDNA